MSFGPDPTKQAKKVIISRETIKLNHPLLFCNGNPVVQTDIQKHLGMFLDTKLRIFDHLKTRYEKKIIALLCKL